MNEGIVSEDLAQGDASSVDGDPAAAFSRAGSSPVGSSAEHRSFDVLVVEDTAEFRQIISAALVTAGFNCQSVLDGETAVDRIEELAPDVIVLDIGLPGIDGIEVCRRIRHRTDAYIIMLTARADEVDKLIGLAVGADDYLTKPFSTRELVARIGAMMRRPRTAGTPSDVRATDLHTAGDLRLNSMAREVTITDETVALTRIEFDLLEQLLRHREMVVERARLLDAVWGRDWVGDDHLVDVHIANLRRKIDIGGRRHIKTVRGIGYRISPHPMG